MIFWRIQWVIAFLAMALILIPPALPAQTDEYNNDYIRHYNAIASMEQRYEAGTGAESTLEYLKNFAESSDINFQVHDIFQAKNFHSYGKNIRFVIPGTESSQLLLFLPYIRSSKSSSQDENAAAVAGLLSILENSPDRQPLSTVQIYFLGALEDQKGLREYLGRNSPVIPETVLYLSSDGGLNGELNIYNGDNHQVSPLWLVRYVLGQMRTLGLPDRLANNRTQLYRIGLTLPGQLERLLSAELNSIELKAAGSSDLSVDGRIIQLIRNLVFETGEEAISRSADITGSWDQHYLNFRFAGENIILSERQYIMGVMGILLLLLFWLVIFKRRRDKYFRTLSRNFWNLPLLYAAMFVFIFLGSLMVSLVEIIRGIEDLWSFIPVPLLLLKVLSASFLFTIFFTIIRRFPFSKNGSFYSASAIMILSLDVFIFGAIDITYAYYFLWALFWSFLFSMSKSRIFKLLCAVLAPLLILLAFVNVILLEEVLVVGQLVSLLPGINLLVAFIVLPFMLMLIRIDFLFPHPVRGKAKNRRNFTLRYTAIVMMALMVINLMVTLFIQPFGAEYPQTITVNSSLTRAEALFSEDDAQENNAPEDDAPLRLPGTISAYSQGRMGNFSLEFDGQIVAVQRGGKSVTMPLQQLNTRIKHTARSQSFLRRRSYRIEISSDIPAEQLNITMYTDQDISVYDSNLPYRSLPGRGEIHFFAGSNPPDPMVLEFTLPSSALPHLRINGSFILANELKLSPDDHRNFVLASTETLELYSTEPESGKAES